MRLNCPICGERDLREYQYLGDAKLLTRPRAVEVANPANAPDQAAFYDYVYIRENEEGPHDELWQHEYGCRAWLHVTRDTKTHEIFGVKLAREVKLGMKK